MKVKLLGKSILFTFVEDTMNGSFMPSNKGKILIATSKDIKHSHEPKWGKVTHKGPDVDESIKIGNYILIESLQWTQGFDIDDTRYWKTDEDKVLVVSNKKHTSY